MHILICTDQHASSLGGVQVSIRLQERFLRALGHTVSVVAPRMRRDAVSGEGDIDLPGLPITLDREYSALWPGKRALARIAKGLEGRPPVDIVHVQGDYWGAVLGYRFAEARGLPVVHTMHNHMDFGIREVVPFPGIVIRGLCLLQRIAMPPRRSTLRPSSWSYLNEFALRAAAVTAPSGHFARLLEGEGVARNIDVVWTGADDAAVERVLAHPAGPNERPVFVWTGRMSNEKRLMEFIAAVELADVDAEFRLYGQGLLLAKAKAAIARAEAAGLRSHVRFMGKVSYDASLAGIEAADALVQTSIGFETQGMTVFEAAALGTPSIVSDPRIAGELPAGVCTEPRDGSVEALAEAIVDADARIRAGSWLNLEPATAAEFRQSHQTGLMIAVYEAALSR